MTRVNIWISAPIKLICTSILKTADINSKKTLHHKIILSYLNKLPAYIANPFPLKNRISFSPKYRNNVIVNQLNLAHMLNNKGPERLSFFIKEKDYSELHKIAALLTKKYNIKTQTNNLIADAILNFISIHYPAYSRFLKKTIIQRMKNNLSHKSNLESLKAEIRTAIQQQSKGKTR